MMPWLCGVVETAPRISFEGRGHISAGSPGFRSRVRPDVQASNLQQSFPILKSG
jgi:hypothetical protein